MSPSAQNALINENYCLCQQGDTFKYSEQMQMIRVRKKQTHFNKKSSWQVLFCSYQHSTGCLEGRMLAPLAFKGNGDVITRRDLQLVQKPAAQLAAYTPFCSLPPLPGSRFAAPGGQRARGRAHTPGSTCPGESTGRAHPAEGTGTPELISSSSPLAQPTLRVLHWRYMASCHLTPTLSVAPNHNDLASETPLTARSEGSI